MHLSITNAQYNSHNLQGCICIPTMLQSPNLKHHPILQTCTNAPPHMKHPKGSSKPCNQSRSTPQPINNQISDSITCMNGPITYWSSTKLKIRWFIGIWTILGVRLSSPLLVLHFIALFFLGSYNAFEIFQLPLLINHMGLFKPYSF